MDAVVEMESEYTAPQRLQSSSTAAPRKTRVASAQKTKGPNPIQAQRLKEREKEYNVKRT